MKMWLIAFFMIAAVFGNPEGWCNIFHLKLFFYDFTSIKKNGTRASFSSVLFEPCPSPNLFFQNLYFYSVSIFYNIFLRVLYTTLPARIFNRLYL